MKILYFAPTSTLYGDNIALLNILPILKLKGIDFHIITSQKGDFTNKLAELGYFYHIQLFYTNLYPPFQSIKDVILFIPRILRGIIKNKIYIKKTIPFVKKYAPDIIHTNNGLLSAGYVIAKKMDIPHVWHLREYENLGRKAKHFPSKKSFITNLNSKINYSIAISKGVYSSFKLSNKSIVINDGVFYKKTATKQKKEAIILFVGRLIETKGIKDLLYAFIDFSSKNNNYILEVVGAGDEEFEQELYHIVEKAGLKERISFLGYRKDIYELMSNAEILVVPSYSEGFGFTTAEAMYNKCLVIGNNSSGTKEQFDNGLELSGNEIGIRYNTTKELIAAMCEVSEKGIEHYHSMIERAYETVCSLYTIEQSAEKVYNYYRKILNK